MKFKKNIKFYNVFIVMLLNITFNCDSLPLIKNSEKYGIQPNFKVIDLKIKHKDEFFLGLKKVICIKADIEVEINNYNVIGYTKESFCRNLFIKDLSLIKNTNVFNNIPEVERKWLIKNYNKVTCHVTKIIPIFMQGEQKNNIKKIYIELKEGGPVGHNIFEINIGDKKELVYWYKLK